MTRVGTFAGAIQHPPGERTIRPQTFPDAVSTPPAADSIRPGAFLSPGAGAPFRCDVPPRSQLPALRGRAFYLVVDRSQPGSDAIHESAELHPVGCGLGDASVPHAHNMRSTDAQGLTQCLQERGNGYDRGA